MIPLLIIAIAYLEARLWVRYVLRRPWLLLVLCVALSGCAVCPRPAHCLCWGNWCYRPEVRL